MPKTRSQAEPQKILVELRADHIEAAIEKLGRRLKDFTNADPNEHLESVWAYAESLCNRLSSTLQEIYGLNSIQLDRVEIPASSFVAMFVGRATSPHEKIQAFEHGRKLAISRIETELSHIARATPRPWGRRKEGPVESLSWA